MVILGQRRLKLDGYAVVGVVVSELSYSFVEGCSDA